MSSEFAQNIAPNNDGSSAPPETTQDAPQPAPITEQEVGEYREQDRFLPVSVVTLPDDVHSTPFFATLSSMTDALVPKDCECSKNNEI